MNLEKHLHWIFRKIYIESLERFTLNIEKSSINPEKIYIEKDSN